jgi:hypothetical protein
LAVFTYEEVKKEGALTTSQLQRHHIAVIGETERDVHFVRNTSHGLIAEYSHDNDHELMYFPQDPKHASQFAASGYVMKALGPGDIYPGSVGVLHYEFHKKTMLVQWVQGSFKTGEPKELTRAIVSKHGGWRLHLFDEALKRAKRFNIKKVVFAPEPPLEIEKVRQAREAHHGNAIADFRKVAERPEHGFHVEEKILEDLELQRARREDGGGGKHRVEATRT